MGLPFLLDDDHLTGTVSVSRRLSPPRSVAVVDRGDFDDAHRAIGQLCLRWGGGCSGVVPASRGAEQLTSPWIDWLRDGVFDSIDTGDVLKLSERRFEQISASTHPERVSLLSVIRAEGPTATDWPAVDCVLPERDNPWFLAYLGCLGSWPAQADPADLRAAGFRDDAALDLFIGVTRGTVAAPGPTDLMTRLRQNSVPAQLSCVGLRSVGGPEASHMSEQPPLPMSGMEYADYGSNWVVVYESDNVDDLCLLWNMRAGHGLGRGVPLATPLDEAEQALAAWSNPDGPSFALRLFGLVPGRPWGLISSSVDLDVLRDLATRVGGNWQAVEVAPGLIPGGDRPFLSSRDVAVFGDGMARVAAVAAPDRDRVEKLELSRPHLHVRITPDREEIPPLQRFARFLPYLPGFQGGGAEFRLSRPDDILPVHWPARWTVLQAAVESRGFVVKPSRPGQAAMALLRQIDGFVGAGPLADASILELVQWLGDRAGRNWFEDQMRRLAPRVETAEDSGGNGLAAIEASLSELSFHESDDENRRELTLGKLEFQLGRDAARAWLKWAEMAGVLVRGVRVQCQCGHSHWRPAQEMALPIACPGCGQEVARPYGDSGLSFIYRAGEALRQTVTLNALSHVVSGRWIAEILDGQGLYGLYPGVDIYDGAKRVGEIDLLLLFRNGDLAVGECKRTPAGLTEAEVAKTEGLADQLGAMWTFYSVTAWRSEFEPPTDLVRQLPDRPRYLLTLEQLTEQPGSVFWALGDVPFIRPALGENDCNERTTAFRRDLPKLIADAGHRYVDDVLLEPDPEAEV